MIRLAVFCDGTWNGLQMQDLTNVARLARSIERDAVGENGEVVPQLVYYDEGVGTATGVSRTSDRLEAILGGAFGAGLDRKIEQAYRFIVLNYKEPDDEIFIFGFSRGAYTARSLCGLIRKCGILRPEHLQRVPEAMQLYRNRKIHPAGPECQEFRRNFARNEVVGAEDLARNVGQEPPGVLAVAGEGPEEDAPTLLTAKVRKEKAVRIRYVGLWDTVGSLGVPDRFVLLSGFNKRFRFHDTAASQLIESLRHAIAADEDRRTFSAAPFSNIRELNITAAEEENAWIKEANRSLKRGATPQPLAQVTDAEKPGYIPYDERRYQQKWFPGDHGSVGGGNPEHGLSSSALLWVAEGAQRAGLAFTSGPMGELAMARDKVNPLADWRIGKSREITRPPWHNDMLGLIGGLRSRTLAITIDEVHPSARRRWRKIINYRPRVFEAFTGRSRLALHRYVEFVVGPPFRLLFSLFLVAVALVALWLLARLAIDILCLLPGGLGEQAAERLDSFGRWLWQVVGGGRRRPFCC